MCTMWIIVGALLAAGRLVEPPPLDENALPAVQLRLPGGLFCVGEPIIAEIGIQNAHDTRIRNRYANPDQLSKSAMIIEFRDRASGTVGVWANLTPGAHASGYMARSADSGEFLMLLAPRQSIACRKPVVLFQRFDDDDKNELAPPSRALPPGTYELVCKVPWIEGSIETEPIEIRIVEASRPEDRAAADLIDAVFSRFLAGGEGMVAPKLREDGSPPESVKRVLETAPDSVHAQVARSVLLLRQCQCLDIELFKRLGSNEDRRVETLREALGRIDSHLRSNPRDPFADEFLYRRTILLQDMEDINALRSAVSDLRDRFPDSWYAREAKRRMDEFLREP